MSIDATDQRFDGMTPPPYPLAAKVAFGAISGLIVLVAIAFLASLTQTTEIKSLREQTKINLRAAAALLVDYEVRTEKVIDHRFPTMAMHAARAQGKPAPDSWTEQMVSELAKEKEIAQGLLALGRDAYTDSDGDGFKEILDGWGRPMIYVHSVSHKDGFLADDFMPEHKSPYLYSAGPDGIFGDVSDPKDTTWQDNVSSFILE